MIEPQLADRDFSLFVGDCRDVLASLPSESVHCVVTSPPYWGLRDYGTALWEGGDPAHEHEGATLRTAPPGSQMQEGNVGANAVRSGDCACGARRIDSQIGLEETPEGYVEAMVETFRELRRVLRRDGLLWLNLGDTYGKQKQLSGVPWKVALALVADGWVLRADVIWSKPNPMPESVRDRPSNAHEYLFLLARSGRYFYDGDAIREPVTRERSVWPGIGGATAQARVEGVGAGGDEREPWVPSTGRNRRSVWEIALEPYAEAHFATFPQALVEPCILAGTSEIGVCPACGAPWKRLVEVVEHGFRQRALEEAEARSVREKSALEGSPFTRSASELYAGALTKSRRTVGWRPSCEHASLSPVPATVLDPFLGSGTTALVARRLGRHCVGIELSGEFAELIATRTSQLSLLADAPPLEEVALF